MDKDSIKDQIHTYESILGHFSRPDVNKINLIRDLVDLDNELYQKRRTWQFLQSISENIWLDQEILLRRRVLWLKELEQDLQTENGHLSLEVVDDVDLDEFSVAKCIKLRRVQRENWRLFSNESKSFYEYVNTCRCVGCSQFCSISNAVYANLPQRTPSKSLHVCERCIGRIKRHLKPIKSMRHYPDTYRLSEIIGTPDGRVDQLHAIRRRAVCL